MAVFSIFVFIASLLISKTVIGLIKPRAIEYGFFAEPNDDVRTHTKLTPLLGGAGILIVFLPVVVFLSLRDSFWKYTLAGLIIIASLGLFKDKVRRPVSPGLQLVIQTVSSSLLLAAGTTRLGAVNGDPIIWASYLIVCLFLINGWNFLDVVDGLAGGIAILTGLFFIVAAVNRGDSGLLLASCALTGSIFGFLLHNLPPASIFMGDVGSFGIAFVICSFVLKTYPPNGNYPSPLLLLVFAPIVLEVTFSITGRLCAGNKPWKGNDQHLSLVLLNRGWQVKSVLSLFYGISFFSGILAMFLQ